MKAKDLRKKFLDFFASKQHAILPSSSVIPENDPTVLFTTAGMQPLVPFLMGKKHPKGERLVDAQKCIRTNDIEEVGDEVHHTFFEMLGNWSLGDYFKKEAIAWSYEFLTKELDIPPEKLAISVFKGDKDAPKDEEAASYWKELGIPEERVAYLPKSENWWGPAGQTGPCGPDTEMFYWTGEKAPKKFDPEDSRWVEIWNDVFMQYNKKEDGSFEELSQQNVDTGMGLERVTAVLQGKEDDYETELFSPIIKTIGKLSGKKYKDNKKAMRVIADHLKAAVFILAEQKVAPSNVDQGYVLRRLIRRAIRYGRQLGIADMFTTQVAEPIFPIYTEYDELKKGKEFILTELKKEEERFTQTLQRGLNVLAKMLKEKKELSGKDTFLLFQSYGFPIEMTEELAKEKKVKVDKKAFEKAYEDHQNLSRKGAEQKFKGGLADASEQTTKLHTATHLLNQALREVLSDDIRQRGSNITSERLRFDFNFDRKLTDEEKKKIEEFVNKKIKEGLEVKREEMPLEKALKVGAQGEFGAKYPDTVSVYTIEGVSKEICMGPHVNNTKEIGTFKIIKEESIAAGIRRIKAVIE